MRGVKWVAAGRALLGPDVRTKDLHAIVADATTVQLDQPIPDEAMRVLADTMAANPDVALYAYGYTSWGPLRSLSFLDGFEHIQELGLAVFELEALDGLERFANLRKLSLRHGRGLALRPLTALAELVDLHIDMPRFDASVLSDLPHLEYLNMSARRGALAPLTNHPALRRLNLHYGTERDLRALSSCEQLRDLKVWCIKQLGAEDLRPIGLIPKLDALGLGALRNVTSLDPLIGSRIRFLELEQIPSLDTLAPLAKLPELRACTIFDTRPVDRSLAGLVSAPKLEEVVVGGDGRFPEDEVDRMFEAFAGRRAQYRQRTVGPEEPLRLSWRGLFRYVDRIRAAESG